MGRSAKAVVLMAAAGAAGCMLARPAARRGPLVEEHLEVHAGTARAAQVEIAFVAGQLDVRPGPGPALLALDARDDVEDAAPRLELDRQGETAWARAWFDVGSRFGLDGADGMVNEWRLEISERLPLDLEVEAGMFDGTLELGGLPLRKAKIELGMGRGVVRFSRPNPRRLDSLTLDVGAGEFRVEQLGNARCASIALELAAGEFVLDLAGAWEVPALIRIEAAICSLTIEVPAGLALRLDAAGTGFADFEAHGLAEVGGGVWLSPEAQRGETPLVVELASTFGNVMVRRR